MTKEYPMAWGAMTSVLLGPDNCDKIEWLIGAASVNDGREIKKICILHGGCATGKSTILNIIQTIIPEYSIIDPYYEFIFSSALNYNKLNNNKKYAIVGVTHDSSLKLLEKTAYLDAFLQQSKKRIIFWAANDEPDVPHIDLDILTHVIDIPMTGMRFELGLYKDLRKQIYDSEIDAIRKRCIEYYLNNPNLHVNYISRRRKNDGNN